MQGCLEKPLAEFGGTGEKAVKQVSDWLGGAAEAPHSYSYIVKYGVGEAILHRFTGIPDSTIKSALAALGPTEREKRMLEQIEAERKTAETEARRQAEIIQKAEQEKAEASAALQTAEKERTRQMNIARGAKSGPRYEEAKAKEAEHAKVRDEATQKKDTAKATIKQAKKVQRAVEEIATTSTKAEAQKRVAAEKQAHYDEKANKVWEKWTHVNTFRDLCLEPGNQRILAKSKQVEFARYIKKSIRGEVTVARIQDLFRTHVNNFLAGVRAAQKKKKPPIETVEDLLRGWKRDLAAARKKTALLRDHCDKHRFSKLTSFIAMGMEEEMSKVIAEFGETCDYFDLNVECLNYTPPLQEKVVSIC